MLCRLRALCSYDPCTVQGSGTLYFTSIRKVKGTPFTPCEWDTRFRWALMLTLAFGVRFRVISDDGMIVNMLAQS